MAMKCHSSKWRKGYRQGTNKKGGGAGGGGGGGPSYQAKKTSDFIRKRMRGGILSKKKEVQTIGWGGVGK